MIECTLLCLYLSLAERVDLARETDPPLIVEYYERPPYAWTGGDGTAQGMAIDRLRTALKGSGVRFRFVLVPATRQLHDVTRTDTPLCAVARYKTPERERQAKFSRMLVQERPYVAFSRQDSAIGAQATIDDLLRDTKHRVVVKIQKSYGATIDAALASAHAPLIAINGNAVNAARMVTSGRADVALLTMDEVEFVVKALGLPDSSYSISRITELDQGEMNYLMCTKATQDGVLNTINAMLAGPMS
jgi:uncharacterized protein (TIGR02285 family)